MCPWNKPQHCQPKESDQLLTGVWTESTETVRRNLFSLFAFVAAGVRCCTVSSSFFVVDYYFCLHVEEYIFCLHVLDYTFCFWGITFASHFAVLFGILTADELRRPSVVVCIASAPGLCIASAPCV